MKKKRRFSLLILLGLFSILILASPTGISFAQEPTPSDDDINTIARKLYCPVCENTPLDVCPTQACRQWREEIRLRLAQGWTEQEILDYFVEQYGYRVLAEPPRSGFNWLVYIVPPLLFLIGSFILYRAFRSWRSSEPEIPEGGEETLSEPKKEEKKDKYVSQLEEELRKRG